MSDTHPQDDQAQGTQPQGDVQQAKDEAVEAVVERVESWQDGAEPQVVESELREGFDEAEVDVPDEQVSRLAEQIHADGKADADQVDPA